MPGLVDENSDDDDGGGGGGGGGDGSSMEMATPDLEWVTRKEATAGLEFEDSRT